LLATTGSVAAAPPAGPAAVLPVARQEPESVYAPPAPPSPEDGTNQGAVHIELSILYSTDYIFRGIERFEVPDREDNLNLQIDTKLSFDLGKLPHPFVEVFVNVSESDPISTFQEIRPTVGFDWNIRPITFSAGHTTYLFPDRDDEETSEVFARITIDDSYFLRLERPLLSPYVFGAYDYDRYNGWYLEAGVEHVMPIEDTGLTLVFNGQVAYARDLSYFSETPQVQGDDDERGFQHYQVGMKAVYSLNSLLNIPQRYGNFSVLGYVNYTGGLDDDMRADSQLWGGAGIRFEY
jgi:hypothetical protein